MTHTMTLLTGLAAYLKRILITLSILLNVVLGGKTNQTFSARNYQRQRDNKINLVKLIDLVFGDTHCLECWTRWRLTRTW